MGTTRIKVIDLSSDQKEIKTSRKHAEKLSGAAKLKSEDQKTQQSQKVDKSESQNIDESENQSISVSGSGTPTQQSTDIADTQENRETDTSTHKPTDSQTHRQGKKYLQVKKQIENKIYKVKEALEIFPKTSTVKFDPSVEIHLNVVDQKIKGNVKFPHAFKEKKGQKQTRYLIFTDKRLTINDKPIVWGDEKTINDIENGTLKPSKDFDVVIASPKFMPKIAKIAKILGPRGMMPNPKNGTITEDFEKAVSGANSEEGYAFKSDPNAAIVHAKIGKLSQKPAELEENLKALITAVGQSKIKKATLTSTMGPPVKLDTASL